MLLKSRADLDIHFPITSVSHLLKPIYKSADSSVLTPLSKMRIKTAFMKGKYSGSEETEMVNYVILICVYT